MSNARGKIMLMMMLMMRRESGVATGQAHHQL